MRRIMIRNARSAAAPRRPKESSDVIKRIGMLSGLWLTLAAGAARAQTPTPTPVVSPTPGPRIHVDHTVSASGDGLSWAGAKKTVAEGLAAGAGMNVQVWVADGTYMENLTMPDRVELYGGFTGLDGAQETDLSQRDPAANPTVLDGGGAGSVITADGVQFTRIDGFHAVGGLALFGGGLRFNNADATNRIFGCVIEANEATDSGGGISLVNSGVVIEDCVIRSNKAERGGGGVWADLSTPVVRGCLLEGNILETFRAAPMSVVEGSPEGKGRAAAIIIAPPDANIAPGGGIGLRDCPVAEIDACRFQSNVSRSDPAGVPAGPAGSAIGMLNCPSVVIRNCAIANNVAGSILHGDPGAGTVTFVDSGGEIIHSSFSGNISHPFSGPLPPFFPESVGGAVLGINILGGPGSVRIVNSIFHNHESIALTELSTDFDFLLENCLFHANPDGDLLNEGNFPLFTSGQVIFGAANINSMVPEAFLNIGGNPRFYDPYAGDLRLGPTSAALDTGMYDPVVPAFDIEGMPRPVDIPGRGADGTGTEFDIGAREMPAVAPTPNPTRTPTPTPVYRIHVDGDAVSSGSGHAWSTAKRTVSEAVTLAESLGSVAEIWIADGSYYENVRIGYNQWEYPTISLYGGFTGLSGSMETSLAERDHDANPTIIDGGGTGSAIEAWLTQGVFDGLRVTGGLAPLGGGLNVLGSAEIRNCRIYNNTSAGKGGGIASLYGSVVISNCIVETNRAADDGGGIYVEEPESLRIEDCVIAGNVIEAPVEQHVSCSERAESGIFTRGHGRDLIVIEDFSTIGGGIAVAGFSADVRLVRVRIESNRVTYAASTGCPFMFGGGVGIYNCYLTRIENCIISNNVVDWDSQADGILAMGGGVIIVAVQEAEIFNSTLSGNRILEAGEGSRAYGDAVATFFSSDLKVTNTILHDSGDFALAELLSPVSVLQNCLFNGNPDGDVAVLSNLIGPPDAVYTGAAEINSMIPGASGNLDGDPLFFDAEGGDFRLHPGSPAIDTGRGGAEIPLVDINGFPRPVDIPGAGADGTETEFDIGAWEMPASAPSPPPSRTPTATPTPTPSPSAGPSATPTPAATVTPPPTASATPVCCPGDANNSGGAVNAQDFLAVQANFGLNNGTGGLGDADCSGGAVNASDFLAVQANFGLSCG